MLLQQPGLRARSASQHGDARVYVSWQVLDGGVCSCVNCVMNFSADVPI